MYRITHARDPVPHLPPPNLVGFKYVHVNYEVWHPCQILGSGQVGVTGSWLGLDLQHICTSTRSTECGAVN